MPPSPRKHMKKKSRELEQMEKFRKKYKSETPHSTKNSQVFSTVDLSRELRNCKDQAEEDFAFAEEFGDELCFLVKNLRTEEPSPGLGSMPYCL